MLSKAQAATFRRLSIAEPEALRAYVGVVDGVDRGDRRRATSRSSDSRRS